MDPDIIIPGDSSVFESISYNGQAERTVYDRRSGWVTINAFLFSITWNDGLSAEAQVNPEFATVEAAADEAEKYAVIIGRLPACLRRDVDALWIHAGTQPFGGGNRSLLIHTGQSSLYEADGILEETLVHEASHTSLDAEHATSAAWLNAASLDGAYISDYARDYPEREDIAESFLPWLAVRHRSDRISEQDYNTIMETIPNRLEYFDDQDFELSPLEPVITYVEQNFTPLRGEDIILYPNPVRDLLNIKNSFTGEVQISIYNHEGTSLFQKTIATENGIDLSALSPGIYIVALTTQNMVCTKKIIKQ